MISPVAIRATMTAVPITSAGRFSGWGLGALSVSFERDEIGPQKVTPCGYQHGPNDNGPQIDAFRQQ
jgi:hypothetical protein